MFTRLCLKLSLCMVLVSLLGACSSVPDRYAPWRDDNHSTGKTPNLGDVPAAPNTDAAKAEMESMRQRLEADRNNAYLAAQGIVPLDAQPVTEQPAAPIANDELPPVSSTEMPLPSSSITTDIGVLGESNVVYNYEPNSGTDYVYGNTPSQFKHNAMMTASNDPSISIDWGTIDGGLAMSQNTLSSTGISSSQPVAYFAHGSASLTAKDRKVIKQLADDLKKSPQPIMLAGNASRRTGLRSTALSREINFKMSAKRAEAVMKALLSYGVSPEQIYISAYGDSIPNSNPQGNAEASDRRVEVVFGQF
jgi:outer membrane protein OmpA-like peptidoglycan-associated protein